MKTNLKNLILFIKFTHKFQKIVRHLYATGLKRDENDMEHSYQLALTAWYLIDSEKFELDINKTIKYALVHDLVETYAGDTYFHTKDKELRDSKETREKAALEKIDAEFKEFPDLAKFIKEYDARIDLESKFVYALDKMLPVLNIYLDDGRSWKRDNVTYEMLRTKDDKVKVSPEIEKLWYELVKELETNRNRLFSV